MPKQVLVAIGAVFGLSLLLASFPAFCAESEYSSTEEGHKTEEAENIDISLEDALRRSLDRNPLLAAYASEVEARTSEVRQAGLFANPELSVEMENFSGSGNFSGSDNAELTARLSQKFELGRERSRRVAVSSLDRDIAEQAYIVARDELTARTTRLFVDVQTAQQRLALAEDQVSLAGKTLDAVSERIAAGKAPAIERLRFESLLLESELRQEQASQELVSARYALAALWNQESPDFKKVYGDFHSLPEISSWSDLVAMIDKSPGLSLKRFEADRAGSQVSFEKSKRLPDVNVEIGRKEFEDTGDHSLIAGLSINVPIFDRNQGAVEAAQARQVKARSALQSARFQMRSDLGHIWQRLQKARTEAQMLRERLLPNARDGFEATSYGYRVGKFGYLDVLNAEQALFDARLRYIDILRIFHHTRADLEALLGRKINVNDNEAVSAVVQ